MAKSPTRPLRERAQTELDQARMKATRLEQRAADLKDAARKAHQQAVDARQIADHAATHPALRGDDESHPDVVVEPEEQMLGQQPEAAGPVQAAVAAVPQPEATVPKAPTAAQKRAAAKVAAEKTGDEAQQNEAPTAGPGPGANAADDDNWFNT